MNYQNHKTNTDIKKETITSTTEIQVSTPVPYQDNHYADFKLLRLVMPTFLCTI